MVRMRPVWYEYVLSFVCCLLVIYAGVLMPELSIASERVDCDKEYNNLESGGDNLSLNEKIEYWKSLGEQCSKSGIYESRLAKLYSNAGRYKDAMEVLFDGLSYKSSYDKELRSDMVDVYIAQGDYEKAEVVANNLINDYGTWFGGYFGLGEIHLIHRRFRDGINLLEKSNSLLKTQGAYLMLVIAYHQIDAHEQTVSSMKSAIDFGDSALKNRGAVISTAYSLIALGRLQDAKDILSAHQKMTAGSEEDQGFIRVVMYLKKKIDEVNK